MTPPSGPNQSISLMTEQDRRKYTVERQLEEILTELRMFRLAFPEDENGDVDVAGHRKYHDAKIQAAKAEAEFWRELKLEVAKKGLWFIITVLAGLIFVGMMAKLGLSPAGGSR